MNGVRPFVEADVPQVADLHRRVFRGGDRQAAATGWLETYRTYFSRVFLNERVTRGTPASLVFESEGRILGFLGVMPRRMRFKGRPILMAVCSQFAVDPAGRGQVGLRMLKHCLQGPQDLSVTDEAADSTRKLWEWCGGGAVLPYSMRWIRPLRPARLIVSLVAGSRRAALLASVSAPFARIADGVIGKLGPAALRVDPPRGTREQMDAPAFQSCLADAIGDRSLVPEYDSLSTDWAFERANRRTGVDIVRTIAVRDDDRAVSGGFVYCIGRDKLAEVLHVSARPQAIGHVLDHLFDDAMRQGAAAVTGRMEPAIDAALADRRSLFYRGGPWTLVHSRRPDVRHAILSGDAFLTRLEGEWCLRFP